MCRSFGVPAAAHRTPLRPLTSRGDTLSPIDRSGRADRAADQRELLRSPTAMKGSHWGGRVARSAMLAAWGRTCTPSTRAAPHPLIWERTGGYPPADVIFCERM